MAFVVNYQVGGEVDKVKYVEEIKNFAQLPQPYNEMVKLDLGASPNLGGRGDFGDIYDLEYISPDQEAELLSIVITCSGYGEKDFYNLYVQAPGGEEELWFKTWYPTEVKEGLYIGTSTYVYKLEPKTKFRLEFHNASLTSKVVWMGIRMLVERTETSTPDIPDDLSIPSIPDGIG